VCAEKHLMSGWDLFKASDAFKGKYYPVPIQYDDTDITKVTSADIRGMVVQVDRGKGLVTLRLENIKDHELFEIGQVQFLDLDED
jgi:hypothetical protein